MRLLLKAGVDVNAADQEGFSVLHHAVSLFGFVMPGARSVLHIVNSTPRRCQPVIRHPSSVVRVSDCCTTFRQAAGGRHGIVQCLLDEARGLDVCARAPNGEDAAIMATKSGFSDLASKVSA